MDVIAILRKMHAEMPENFEVKLVGEKAEEYPQVFTSMKMTYIVNGSTDKNKLIKAVKLSQETYCALSIMAKKITDFSYVVLLNGEKILEGN